MMCMNLLLFSYFYLLICTCVVDEHERFIKSLDSPRYVIYTTVHVFTANEIPIELIKSAKE